MTENVLQGVRLRLDGAGFPGLRRIQVSMNRGVIVLRGRLASFHEKQIAIELTRHVAGVHRIDNHIEVESVRFNRDLEREPLSGAVLGETAQQRGM
jgi:hypothetical protein